MILQKWSQVNIITEEDQRLPITKFIRSVEQMQRVRNTSSLSNLIGRIKDMKRGKLAKAP